MQDAEYRMQDDMFEVWACGRVGVRACARVLECASAESRRTCGANGGRMQTAMRGRCGKGWGADGRGARDRLASRARCAAEQAS